MPSDAPCSQRLSDCNQYEDTTYWTRHTSSSWTEDSFFTISQTKDMWPMSHSPCRLPDMYNMEVAKESTPIISDNTAESVCSKTAFCWSLRLSTDSIELLMSEIMPHSDCGIVGILHKIYIKDLFEQRNRCFITLQFDNEWVMSHKAVLGLSNTFRCLSVHNLHVKVFAHTLKPLSGLCDGLVI